MVLPAFQLVLEGVGLADRATEGRLLPIRSPGKQAEKCCKYQQTHSGDFSSRRFCLLSCSAGPASAVPGRAAWSSLSKTHGLAREGSLRFNV